ncbi:MAG: glycoside hydrolase domain-containing protein [Promethearchaeota archaeon]
MAHIISPKKDEDILKSNGRIENAHIFIETILLGLSLAVLMFFIQWSVQPEEIVRDSPHNSVKFILFYISIGSIISFLLVSIFYRNYKIGANSKLGENWNGNEDKKDIRIINTPGGIEIFVKEFLGIILVISSSILLLITFARYNSDGWEWWLTQLGWFFRRDSAMIGIFLMAIFIQASIGTSNLLEHFNSAIEKKTLLKVSLILIVTLLNYMLFHLLINPFGLFPVLIYLNLVFPALLLTKLAVLSISKIRKIQILKEGRKLKSTGGADGIEDDKEDELEENREITSVNDINAFKEIGSIFKDINFLIMVFFIFIQILVLIYVYRVELKSSETYITILPMLLGVGLLEMFFIASRYKEHRIWPALKEVPRFANLKTGKKILLIFKEKFGVFIIVIFELLRLVAPFIAVTSLFYGFPTIFYFPGFQAKLSLFVIIGILIFVIIAYYDKPTENHSGFRTNLMRYLSKLMYLICFSSIIYAIFKLNEDIVSNAFSYYGMNFDLIFPFQFLLSWQHASIIGISAGFIIAYEISRLFTRYSEKRDIHLRSNFIPLFIILISFLIMLFGFKNVPGGKITSYPSLTGYYDKSFEPAPFLESQYEFAFWATIISISLFTLSDILFPLLRRVFVGDTKSLGKYIMATDKPIISRFSEKLVYSRNLKSVRTDSDNDKSKNNKNKNNKNKNINKNNRVKVSNRVNYSISVKAIIAIIFIIIFAFPLNYFVIQPDLKEGFGVPLLNSNSEVNIFGAPSNIRIGSQNYIYPIINEDINENNSGSGARFPEYNISMAKNEFESFQLIFRPKRHALNALSYKINDFTNNLENASETFASSNIEVKYVENKYFGTMPERIIDFGKYGWLNLIEQRNHIIWVRIYCPYDQKEGDYSGAINFTYNQDKSIAITLNIHIYNFTVPRRRHIRSNFGGQTYNPEKLETYHKHRINSYGIPIEMASSYDELSNNERKTCWYNESGGEWVFNWTWWDLMTEYEINNGTNAFMVNCPLGMPREPIWLNNDNTTISEWGNKTAKFYEGVESHFEDKKLNESKDWFKYAYIYFIDEFQMFIPEGWNKTGYFSALGKFLALLKQAAPKLKIMTTTPPSPELASLRQYIDIYCPIADDYNETNWAEAKSEGKELWKYDCVGPRAPWPNSHFYNQLYNIRLLYWQLWYYGIQGYLYWHTTPYYHGKYGYGFNAYGDAWYLYEDSEGNVDDTIRWENYRDANEDYEYIWLMHALINATGNNNTELEYLNNLVKGISKDRYNYCSSYKEVLSARNKIGTWISEKISVTNVNLISIGEAEWTP